VTAAASTASAAMILDEWFDGVFCRRAAAPVARFLHANTKMTPDGVTAWVAILGLTMVPLYAVGGYWPMGGGLMFLWLMVQDCVDGQLARLRGGGSWRGRVLDGLADTVCAASAHVGMLVFMAREGVSAFGVTLGALGAFVVLLAAGVSMTWNARVFDGLKQAVKPDTVDADLEKYRPEVKTLFDKFVFWFWGSYSRAIACHRGESVEHSYRMLRRIQWAGPTHHHLLIVLAGLAMPWFPRAPLVYAFVSIVPMNVLVWSTLKFTARPTEEAAAG
jgi:phosphatidylglycerophosphate synthase